MEFKNNHTVKPIVLAISICISLIAGIFIGSNLNQSSNNDISNTNSENNYNQEDASLNNTSSVKNIKVGDTVKVNTDNGDFEIKIDNMKKSNWYDGSDKNCFVGLLECEVNNINFYDQYNPDGLWTEQYLVVTDQNSYLADNWNTGRDDGVYHALEQVPKGTKSKIAIPYVFTKESKSVKININNQYYVSLDIK